MSRRGFLTILHSVSKGLTGPTFFDVRTRGAERLGSRWIATSGWIRGEVISFPLAQTGEGIAECELIKWLVKEGDEIKQFDKICEVQSDKASIEISSPYNGKVKTTPHEVGDVIQVGNTLVEIELEDQSQSSPSPQSASKEVKPLASPAVRLFAKESNVSLTTVQPTGPGGRILKEDVVRNVNEESVGGRKVEQKRVEIKGYHRGMLKSMTMSLTIPHFHFCDDINLTQLLSLRHQMQTDKRLETSTLTLLPILVKALSIVLLDFPEVNSSLSEDHSELILHPEHNIGIAMMTEDGLAVPNIKHVETKSILEITREIQILKRAAKEKKISVADLTGTTISISNIGPIGGRYATPLITPPQAAVVALGRIRPVVSLTEGNNNVDSYPSLPISWGGDHRILDGATLVKFSNQWKELIEDPGKILLSLK